MSKLFKRSRHQAGGGTPSAAARKQQNAVALSREAVAGRRLAKKKSISFDPNRNKVRFIRVPPRSQNPEYWFSERRKLVRKGLQFEIDPDIGIEVNVDSRLRISAMVYPSKGSLAASPSLPSSSEASRDRAFLEVKELPVSLFGDPDENDDADQEGGKWICVGSVAAGGMAKLNVMLPAGVYQLRCSGNTRSLQVFGQAWDVEMELV